MTSDAMKKHLIDSNVFLRALVLSIDKAKQEGKDLETFSSVLNYFSTFIEQHKIELIQSLMQGIILFAVIKQSLLTVAFMNSCKNR